MAKNGDEKDMKGVTRRGFLQLVGAGAVATAATGELSAKPASEVLEPVEMTRIRLLINGRRHRLLVEPRWSLLFVLREKLGLTGTKVGCERGECGACTVLINGEPRYACMTLAVEAEGKEITTIEGLMKGEELGPVQQAFPGTRRFSVRILHSRTDHGGGGTSPVQSQSFGRGDPPGRKRKPLPLWNLRAYLQGSPAFC